MSGHRPANHHTQSKARAPPGPCLSHVAPVRGLLCTCWNQYSGLVIKNMGRDCVILIMTCCMCHVTPWILCTETHPQDRGFFTQHGGQVDPHRCVQRARRDWVQKGMLLGRLLGRGGDSRNRGVVGIIPKFLLFSSCCIPMSREKTTPPFHPFPLQIRGPPPCVQSSHTHHTSLFAIRQGRIRRLGLGALHKLYTLVCTV